MGIFKANIPLLNKFIKHFGSFFIAIFTLAIYAMFKDYKRNPLFEMAKITNTDYQRFQYFFSDSKWDSHKRPVSLSVQYNLRVKPFFHCNTI